VIAANPFDWLWLSRTRHDQIADPKFVDCDLFFGRRNARSRQEAMV
jgi:hypothetical protein